MLEHIVRNTTATSLALVAHTHTALIIRSCELGMHVHTLHMLALLTAQLTEQLMH